MFIVESFDEVERLVLKKFCPEKEGTFLVSINEKMHLEELIKKLALQFDSPLIKLFSAVLFEILEMKFSLSSLKKLMFEIRECEINLNNYVKFVNELGILIDEKKETPEILEEDYFEPKENILFVNPIVNVKDISCENLILKEVFEKNIVKLEEQSLKEKEEYKKYELKSFKEFKSDYVLSELINEEVDTLDSFIKFEYCSEKTHESFYSLTKKENYYENREETPILKFKSESKFNVKKENAIKESNKDFNFFQLKSIDDAISLKTTYLNDFETQKNSILNTDIHKLIKAENKHDKEIFKQIAKKKEEDNIITEEHFKKNVKNILMMNKLKKKIK